MKNRKGLLHREIARILPCHPNILVDPDLIEKLIEENRAVAIFQLPPIYSEVTNAVVVPHRRESVLIIGVPSFIEVATLALVGEIGPDRSQDYLHAFVTNQINFYADHGHDKRTLAKLRALESAIDVQHADKFRMFNSILMNRKSLGGAKAAKNRGRDRSEKTAAIEASGEELFDFDENGDEEKTVIFDEREKCALTVIATAFRAIYGQKELDAIIGPYRVTVKPAPISNIDVTSAARRILSEP